MADFIRETDAAWKDADPVDLAAYVLWAVLFVRPFMNGNGRTAGAASYLVLCGKLGAMLAGAPILPALLRRERGACIAAERHASALLLAGRLDLSPARALLRMLLEEQLRGAGIHVSEDEAVVHEA